MPNDTSSIIDQVADITSQLDTLNINIQKATAQMCSAFAAVGESLSSSLGDAFDNIISCMDTIVNHAGVIQETLGSMWDAEQTITFTDVVLGLVTALEALTSIMTIIDILGGQAAVTWIAQTAAMVGATVATWAQNAAMAVLNVLMSPITWIILAIVAAVGLLVAGFMYLWETNEGFREALIAAWDAIKAAAEAVWGTIVTFFTETIPAAVQWLWDKFTEFGAFMATLWEPVSQFFSACWDAIVAFFTETIPAAVQGVMDFFSGFGDFLSGLWESVGQFFSACWDAIVAFFTETLPEVINNMITWFSELPGKIGEFLNQMVNFFAELPGRIWEFLSDVVKKAVEWCGNLRSTVTEAIPGIVSSITGFFSELPGKMLEIGTNVVKGIWNGINNAAGWVLDKIKGFGTSILNGIKGIFGIASPSKVMRDQVGKNLALGIAEGISNHTDEVSAAMQNMADIVSSTDLSVEPEVDTQSIDFATLKEKLRPSMDFVKAQLAKAQDVLTAQFTASGQLAAIRANAGISNTTNNNQSYNYTIQSNGYSPKATADAIKNQMTMQRMLFATR